MDINPKYAPGGPDSHSLFSASASARWVSCPGSLVLSTSGAMTNPTGEDKSSPAAAEGTMLHAVLNYRLTHGKRCLPADFFIYEAPFEDGKLTDEQADAVEFCVDGVRGILNTPDTIPPVALYETPVNYGRAIGVNPELAFGTCDIAILTGETLHIIDAKFGRNYVSARENTQLELYAMGMIDALTAIGETVSTIRMSILQPRTTGEPETWEISPSELRYDMYQNAVREAYEAASHYDPGDVERWAQKYLRPSLDACRFCPARAICPALSDMTHDVASRAADIEEFDDMRNTKITDTLAVAELVRLHLDAVESEAERRIAAGQKVSGWKLIQGRKGNRKWRNSEDETASLLHDLGLQNPYAKPALLTPAKAETALADLIKAEEGGTKKEAKATAAERLTPGITRSEAKPALVTEETPGEPWNAGADLEEF